MFGLHAGPADLVFCMQPDVSLQSGWLDVSVEAREQREEEAGGRAGGGGDDGCDDRDQLGNGHTSHSHQQTGDHVEALTVQGSPPNRHDDAGDHVPPK